MDAGAAEDAQQIGKAGDISVAVACAKVNIWRLRYSHAADVVEGEPGARHFFDKLRHIFIIRQLIGQPGITV